MKESRDPTGFLARQIIAHENRWKILSLPELRSEAKKRYLHTSGDKKTLLKRLVDWAGSQLNLKFKEDQCYGRSNLSKRDGEASMLGSGSFFKGISSANGDVINDEAFYSPCQSEEDVDDDDESSTAEELELIHPDLSFDVALATDDAGSEKSTNPNEDVSLRSRLKEYFGFSEFRDGQEWAIKRCLENKRSLFVAPTGFGKSICYALPASIMDGICIVVSPLISLMEDQLRRLHPSITALSFSGNLSAAQMAIAMEDLIRKRLKIIFISPERLLSPAFRRLLRPKLNSVTNMYERQLPAVSLLCVDEAHCLSQVCSHMNLFF